MDESTDLFAQFRQIFFFYHEIVYYSLDYNGWL